MSTELQRRWQRASVRPRNVAAIHREFLDRDAWRFREYHTPEGTPRDVAMLGKLIELGMADGQLLTFEDNPAALGASGGKIKRRLHIGLSFPYAMPEGLEMGREYIYGDILSCAYKTRKPHLDTGKLNEYEHEFEDELPQLFFVNGLLRLRFGSYRISKFGIEG